MDRAEAIKICSREKEYIQLHLNTCSDGDGYVSPDGMIRAMDYVEALGMAIAAMREQEQTSKVVEIDQFRNRWISVEERLPGTRNVLITDGDIVKAGFRRPDGVWKYGAESHMRWERLTCKPVTHWMPLPEPPKEGEEG